MSAPILVDELFQRLARRIADGTYPPGARLRDQALAEEFAISRTPVREAMQRLRGIGMIEIYPSRHTVVADVTAESIAATRDFAALSAGCIVRLAVPKLGAAERDRAAALAGEVAAEIAGDGDWLSAQADMLRYLCDQVRSPLFRLLLGDAWYLVIRDLSRDLLSPERQMQRENTATALAQLIRDGDVDRAERAARDVFCLDGG
ncbi:GntR family transcriptional regulator [Microbacterium sp. EST19A]|uniref:GntR family transcriptional regulator n=1 Tax=Microbacterium sp. EST19A TaxID=2862681 RepID=UPI001CC132D3|nr:GntR family transcriptional regulator [Microbacterium sp. EST19A]